jgi:hypothetical protein
VRRVWVHGKPHMLTAVLLAELKGIPESHWEELEPRELARILRPFGPAPRQVRVHGGATGKGYLRA